MKNGVMGNCTFALQEISRPDVKLVRSTLMGTILRLGDVDTRAEEAIEVLVKASKASALMRPATWKKYVLREDEAGQAIVLDEDKIVYAPVKLRTEYYVNRNPEEDEDGDVKMDGENETSSEGEGEGKEEHLEKVEKEELVRGFKYGTTYAPCPDGQFPRLQTQKGIDICGFFHKRKVRFTLGFFFSCLD
jgi:ATP-dependent DNA helicase 2 subunit 2